MVKLTKHKTKESIRKHKFMHRGCKDQGLFQFLFESGNQSYYSEANTWGESAINKSKAVISSSISRSISRLK